MPFASWEVSAAPPTRSRRSRTSVFRPPRARYAAVTRALCPAPMTRTSQPAREPAPGLGPLTVACPSKIGRASGRGKGGEHGGRRREDSEEVPARSGGGRGRAYLRRWQSFVAATGE